MFDIVSIGRSDLLIAVLNGLAILTADDGPAGFGGLIALGLLTGVLLTLARGIVTQRLDLQWVLIGWLMYAVLFAPKVTVTVEDIYTGDTTAVANVPLGVGAIGGLTSTIGLTLTDAFGTAFAFPSITQTGYLDALDIANALREMDYGDANDLTAGSTLQFVDMQRSVRAYLTDCVFFDMLSNVPNPDTSWEEIRTAPRLLEAIEVNSTSWFTTVWLDDGDPDGQTLTCTEAYQTISTNLTDAFLPAWTEYIGTVLGLDDPGPDIQSAVDTLFGVGRSAQDFMLNSLLSREIRLAELGYHAAADNTAGVVMRTQAMEQRRAQWQTEQSMFLEVARPLISYIEAFFYAVSPFMAFLFTLGAFGIALFARYLILAIWVQLWMPVMAINNLYINLAASERLQDIDAAGMDILSLTGLESVWTETTSWLAVGGMLAAATPLLTLMLLTGSYYAFTRLTDRMSGADFVNERIASPNVLEPAALAAAGPLGAQVAINTQAPNVGLARTDVERVVPDIDIGSSLDRSVQSAYGAQQQALSDWASGRGTGLNLNRQEHLEQFARNLNSESLASTHTEIDSVLQRMSEAVVKDEALFQQLSSEERALLQGTIGAALAGRRASERFGVGAEGLGSIAATLANIESLTEGQKQQIAENIANIAQGEEGLTSQLAEAITHSHETGQASRFASALGVADSREFRESQRDVATTTASYNELSALRDSVGSIFRADAAHFGRQAVADGSIDQLEQLAIRHELNRDDVARMAGEFYLSEKIYDPDQARASALGLALSQGSAEARADLARYMAPRFGSASVGVGDATANAEVRPSAIFGDTAQEVRSTIGDLPFSAAELRSDIDAQIYDYGALNESGLNAVRDFFEGSLEGNSQRMEEALAEIDRIATLTRAAHIEENYDDTRSVFRAASDYDWSQTTVDAFVNAGTSIGAAAASYGLAYDEAREQGAGRLSASWTGLGAALRGYKEGFDASVQAQYDETKRLALDRGFPEVVAEYYANQSIMMQQSVDTSVLQWLGLDDDYNHQKREARAALGDSAFGYVHRAAGADEAKRNEYLGYAMDLYRARQLE